MHDTPSGILRFVRGSGAKARMNVNVETIHNHRERAVFETVGWMALRFLAMDDAELLADIACFSLNRLSSRYIRHEVDFAFLLTDRERVDNDRAIMEAVVFGFEFMQARLATKARR